MIIIIMMMTTVMITVMVSKSAFLTLQVLVTAVRRNHRLVRLGLNTSERHGLLVAGMRAMAMEHTVNTGTQSTDPVPVDGTMTTTGMRKGEVTNTVMGEGGRITGYKLLSTERITRSTRITGMEEVRE